MRILKLDNVTKKDILENLLKRSPSQYKEYQESVDIILDDVLAHGDEALIRLTEKFDNVKLSSGDLRVSKNEIKAAYNAVPDSLLETMKRSLANIREFHERQVRQSFITTRDDGVLLGQRITPIEKVGVYVPGGSAPLSSSVLMNIVPAKVAGVDRIVMCTPPGKDGAISSEVLVAADLAGADEIYKCGGAQAIAAMAYGTETIPKVHKIVGPGNMFVTLAKKAVFGLVGIESVAGPSEILVLADNSADPEYVTADLLSQAEHDPIASAILITTDEKLADIVSKRVHEMAEGLARCEIIEKSLENYGYILVADNMDDAIDAVNEIASEHLEIMTEDPFGIMTRVRNAGAIFLGPYSSEPLGDYFAGTNHVLPTNGTARFSSPLSVDEFIKKTSLISYSESALEEASDDIIAFAKAEGLTAHANSIAIRFNKKI